MKLEKRVALALLDAIKDLIVESQMAYPNIREVYRYHRQQIEEMPEDDEAR